MPYVSKLESHIESEPSIDELPGKHPILHLQLSVHCLRVLPPKSAPPLGVPHSFGELPTLGHQLSWLGHGCGSRRFGSARRPRPLRYHVDDVSRIMGQLDESFPSAKQRFFNPDRLTILRSIHCHFE